MTGRGRRQRPASAARRAGRGRSGTRRPRGCGASPARPVSRTRTGLGNGVLALPSPAAVLRVVERRLEQRRDVVRVAAQDLRQAKHVVEPDQRVGDDEPAFRQVGAVVRELDRGFQRRRVVVAEVADDRLGAASASAKSTNREPVPTNEWRPSRPRSTDSSRKPARPPPRSLRYAPSGVIKSVEMTVCTFISANKKTLRRKVFERNGPWPWSDQGQAPAPLVAPAQPQVRTGSHCAQRTCVARTAVKTPHAWSGRGSP